MKYVFVGDLHGKWEMAEEALQRDGTIIFVGDYVDSFDRTTEDMEKTLTIIIDAIKKNKARGLFGNHELSYILPEVHRCSGYTYDTEKLMLRMELELINNLESYIKLGDNWYVTHAGIHPYVWEGVDALPNKDITLIDSNFSRWHWIGQSRGGNKLVGGIWWCDYNKEFEPIPGINQIFGHSSFGGFEGIRSLETESSINYCIDCLDHHKNTFLELEI